MIFVLLGVLAGTIAGLIPGIGIFVTLLILYPWLLSLSPMDTFIFYIALVSTTQYVGSVSATIFGVPGESSSLPAVYEGNALFKQGQGGLAISGAAMGSLLGAFLTLGLVTILSPFFYYIPYFFNTYIQAVVLWTILIVMTISSNKNTFTSFLLVVFGFYLGFIGCDTVAGFGTCHMPIDHPDITTGLPMLSVVGALFIFPQLLKSYKPSFISYNQISSSLLYHFNYFVKNISSAIRGSFIGFFLGFTPGASTALSSNAAHRYEVLREKRKNNYKQGNYRSLVAAETANNSASFTTLLPLFILGIPLAPSEALFYDIITLKGFSFMKDFDMSFFMTTIAFNLIIINILAFMIAWPFAKYISLLYKVPSYLIRTFVFITLCYVLWYVGYSYFQSEYYLIVFFSLLPVGYFLRNFDTMPLIFAFILQDRFYMNSHTLYDLTTSYLQL